VLGSNQFTSCNSISIRNWKICTHLRKNFYSFFRSSQLFTYSVPVCKYLLSFQLNFLQQNHDNTHIYMFCITQFDRQYKSVLGVWMLECNSEYAQFSLKHFCSGKTSPPVPRETHLYIIDIQMEVHIWYQSRAWFKWVTTAMYHRLTQHYSGITHTWDLQNWYSIN